MIKKITFCIAILVAIALSFNRVFAENMAQDASNTMNDSIDKTQNTMNDAGNAVKDAGNSAMNAVNDTVNGAINGTKDAINQITQDGNTSTTANNTSNANNNNNMNVATNNNGNYTATRTATDGNTLLGMNSTTWTWVIMGIVGIAIVSLIWYYAMQTSEHSYDDE